MTIELILLIIELILLALGVIGGLGAAFYAASQASLIKKGFFKENISKDRQQHDNILEDREELHAYYGDPDFDLEKIEKESPEDYKNLIRNETRMFWLFFYRWQDIYIRKIATKEDKRDWNYGIKSAMRSPVHRQVWEKVIQHLDFLGYPEFKTYVDKYLQEGKMSEKA